MPPNAKPLRIEPKAAAPERRRRWLVPFLIGSAVLHLLAALFFVLFQNLGQPDPDTSQATSPTEMAVELQPDGETVAPSPIAPEANDAPPAPPPEAPPIQKPAEPAPEPALPVPQLTPMPVLTPAPPAPPEPAPPRPLPPVAQPPTATFEPFIPPPPQPPQPPRPRPLPAPVQRALPPPPTRQQAAPRPPASGDFFIPPASRPSQRAQGSLRGPLDMSIGPVEKYTAAPPRRNPNDRNSEIQVNGAEVGSDYISDLIAWWVIHRRYPQQAIEKGEQGTVVIRFNVNRLGHTSRAEIISRSGSQWLDMQAIATFGNARLPPLPTNTVGNETTLTITINYQLIR